MYLDTRLFLSNRVIFNDSLPDKLQITNSFWDWCQRIVSWVWAPTSYSLENRRTVSCFKNYLTARLGAPRLQRMCCRYGVDFDRMAQKGKPLLTRDIAKIVIGARNVGMADIDGVDRLNQIQLAQKVDQLEKPFGTNWEVPDIKKPINGGPSYFWPRFFFDPFLSDRERLQVTRENGQDDWNTFLNNMTVRVIKRDMEVGTLVPGPNDSQGRRQFYYVSARVVTGDGMVSYLFHPVTKDSHLPPLRLFRGTALRNSEIDGVSTLITDLEPDLGRRAYESGKMYDPLIRERLPVPEIESGHSLGSTLVQYRVANESHIKTAYLFNGPGLPESEVEKFNQSNKKVELFIRQSAKDRISGVGQAHIGYRAPPNTKVHFLKYHSANGSHPPHTTVWGREQRSLYNVEEISNEKRDSELYYKYHPTEVIRSIIGPWIASVLRTLRDGSRYFVSSRAHTELGLKIGSLQNGKWRVDHFRPMSYIESFQNDRWRVADFLPIAYTI